MKKVLLILCVISEFAMLRANDVWNMNRCMEYAVEHSSAVQRARWDLATANMEHSSAVAGFFPSVSVRSSAQFSWGRNIDPETNAYNNVTTFNNGYGIYASLTLFDGGQIFNRWKTARVVREKCRNAVEMQRDDRAIAAMLAYVDAVYYRDAVAIAADKASQSRGILTLTKRQEQLGIKGMPDVAQAQATLADDEYKLVQQQNMFRQAMLNLRSVMNFPVDENLVLDTVVSEVEPSPVVEDVSAIYSYALAANPVALDAEMEVKSALYRYRSARGMLFPTISLNAGVSTAYNKIVSGGNTTVSFSQQFKNNFGEYVSATISIPIFGQLSRVSSVKRAKYAHESAKVMRDERLRKLHDDIATAVMDRAGVAAEVHSLIAKVDADSLAYSLNKKKYDEGLLSLIDLQLTANTFYSSRLTLLQKRMLYVLKERLVAYYKGESLYL